MSRNTRKHWTPYGEELLIVLSMQGHTTAEMARRLGRSEKAVERKMYKMKHRLVRGRTLGEVAWVLS